VTYPAADGVLDLSLSARTERGYVIAALSGELDIASAPALREQLLGLLTPATSRLIIDLSAVSYADASGLTVLAGTGRRAGLLGGYLRLAAPPPEVATVLSLTGLDQHLDIFPTVHAAITSPPRSQRRHDTRTGEKTGTAQAQPAAARTGPSWHAVNNSELRMAIAAVLLHADAWRDADPRRQFAVALHDLAQAYAGTSQGVLTRAAHSLLSVLTRQPLTHSPAVAATASRLRRLLDPSTDPPSAEATTPLAPPP
jgi:anti-anti-sigma factor